MTSERISPIDPHEFSARAQVEEVAGAPVVWTFGDLESEISSVLEGAGVFDLWPRSVLEIRGKDFSAFLHGQLSQDIEGMPDNSWRFSFRLHPNGKVESFLRVLRKPDDEGFVIDTDPGYGLALAESLRKYLIRVQVSIESDVGLGYLRVAGPLAPRILRGLGAEDLPGGQAVHTVRMRNVGSDVKLLRAPYPGPGITASLASSSDAISSFDLLVGSQIAPSVFEALVEEGARPCGWVCNEAFRVVALYPALGFELDDKTIVQETGLESVAVSFDKGCYLGQELVARIDSRGHVNRYLRRIRIDPQTTDPSSDRPGSEVLPGAIIKRGDKEVGRITSSVQAPLLGSLCLGYLRREVEIGERVTLEWGPNTVEAVVDCGPQIT